MVMVWQKRSAQGEMDNLNSVISKINQEYVNANFLASSFRRMGGKKKWKVRVSDFPLYFRENHSPLPFLVWRKDCPQDANDGG